MTNTQINPNDVSTFCMRCHRENVLGGLCKRDGQEWHDHGLDREDPENLARFEGLCLRCCGHNHG